MKQCFRMALWMFFLIGYLQAKPVSSNNAGHLHFNIKDLGLEFLRQEVTCEYHVKFTYPTCTEDHCSTAALECFAEGLQHASKNCTGELFRIEQTLDVLELDLEKQPTQTNSSECKWEGNKESHKTFAVFVNAFETFVQQLSIQATTNPH